MSTTECTLEGAAPVTVNEVPSTTLLLGLALTEATTVAAPASVETTRNDRPTAAATVSSDNTSRHGRRAPMEPLLTRALTRRTRRTGNHPMNSSRRRREHEFRLIIALYTGDAAC